MIVIYMVCYYLRNFFNFECFVILNYIFILGRYGKLRVVFNFVIFFLDVVCNVCFYGNI